MSRIVGVIRFDKRKLDDMGDIILKMGSRFKNVTPTMIFKHKNISIGVFEWKDNHKKKNVETNSKEISGYFDDDGCMAIDGKIYYLDEGSSRRYGSLDEKSSAEILYKTYRENGLEEIFNYNSSFSSIIVDKKKDQVIISKDRLGFVPLFVYRDNEKMIFASEIKAILEYPDIKVTPNLKALGLYCFYHYRYAYDNYMTFFKDINFFPPNKTKIICLDSGKEEIFDNWVFKYSPRGDITEEQAKDEFLQLTEKALKERMDVTKPKHGFFMSGGIDSPSVVALGIKRSIDPVNAFSVIYTESEGDRKDVVGDEYKYMKMILNRYKEKIKWHPVTPKGEDLLTYLPELVERFDQPVVTVTTYSFYLLCKQSHKEGFDLMFTGDGPDHLMAGIYDHFYYFFADLKSRGNDELLEREVSYWIKYHNHPVFTKSKEILNTNLERCIDLSVPGKIKAYSWYHPELSGEYLKIRNENFPMVDINKLEIAPSPTNSYLINSLYQYIYHTGSHCASWFEDIALASFGVETRSIFFTREIHEFCWNLPGELMIKDGKFKHLFRESMQDLLPSEVINNPSKSGFNAPSNIWFKKQLYIPFKEMIKSNNFLASQIYDKEGLLEILEDHYSGKSNHMMFLWNAFSTELWLRHYFPDFKISEIMKEE